MEYLDVKSCTTCDKKQVCKYANNRMDIEKFIKGSVIPYAIEDAPFSVQLTCNEHKHDVRERSFA